ncbi:hypothetical protein [Ureaplasma urealyticum]|uniref:Iron ABC transporter substrate-binding protein n=7 Tax=Ureaplasma urealyticum TaxID=2130 RepID=A0AAP9ACN6_UREUR|nr:hypothetical protein [Ureaplasma urealyticum]ACI60317.1 lipoprotein [Ureaplasma urealyticum serovar 10 str. ATCC 33699]EEH01306.1 lipoprotein [Ureaplasma urealyticum serovar 8 str. ATCC 27618]MDU3864872.1 hypothetical protein [Ureaplasma urealyticum]QDI63812.1 hypothetical protein EPH05_02350 [Ureaplasma urealyticum]QDI65018.1 hypothetical protein FJM05_02325 [Ureaplasma urealyticum]
MPKKFKKWFLWISLTLVSTTTLISTLVSCAQQNKISKSDLFDFSEQEPTQWEKEIIDSAKNKNPTFHINEWNASFAYLQEFNAIIGELEAKKDNLNSNDFSKAKTNKIITFIPYVEFDSNKYLGNQIISDNTRVNWPSIISQYTNNKQHDLMAFTNDLLIYSNLKQTPKYQVDNKDLKEDFVRNNNWLNENIDYHLSIFKDIKYDFYLSHWLYQYWIDQNRLDVVLKLIYHANKIILYPDGNAELYYVANYYAQAVKNLISKDPHLSKQKIDDHLHNFINMKSFKEAKNYFSSKLNNNKDWLTVFVLNKLFKIFAIDESWVDCDYFKFSKEFMPKSYKIRTNYANVLNSLNLSLTAKNQFKKNFEYAFRMHNKTFLDFIVDGKQYYDPKKQNLIFMGSSLFKDNVLKDRKIVKQELQQWALKIKNKYPNANYFFKLHPIYNQNQVLDYIQEITNGIFKPIILDAKTPWENILLRDYLSIKNNKAVLFKDKNTPNFSLWGFQPTTSALLTSFDFIRNNTKLTNDEVQSIIGFDNFLVGKNYDILRRDYEPNKDYTNQNLQILERTYGQLIFAKILKKFY